MLYPGFGCLSWYDEKGLKRRSPTFFGGGLNEKGRKCFTMKLKRGLVTMAGEGYDEKGRKRFTLVLVVYRLASCLSKKGLKRRSPTFFWRGLEQKGPKMLYHEAKMRAEKEQARERRS